MIMYSNRIAFPAKHSAQWAEFVRLALEKKPHLRPSAAALLDHPWIGCAEFCCTLLHAWKQHGDNTGEVGTVELYKVLAIGFAY